VPATIFPAQPILFGGGPLTRHWAGALGWAYVAVGMIFFSGVALINGWVMHYLSAHGAPARQPLLYDAFNRLLIAYGWLGNPMFLVGLNGIAILEVRHSTLGLPRWLELAGLAAAVLSWGRGIGSATGMYFLEPLIYANVPAFLWFGYYGLRISAAAAPPTTGGRGRPGPAA
jgi:hypothetical protein